MLISFLLIFYGPAGRSLQETSHTPPLYRMIEKAHIRDNPSAGHWVEDEIPGFCEFEFFLISLSF